MKKTAVLVILVTLFLSGCSTGKTLGKNAAYWKMQSGDFKSALPKMQPNFLSKETNRRLRLM